MNPKNSEIMAGQPINTEDAMNDMPKDDSEAYKAWQKMTPEEAEARSDSFAEDFAGETNTNDKTGKERTESTFDLYPRQAGETNEEYGARIRRMNELKAQFAEENPLPEEPVVEENAVEQANPEAEQEAAKMDMAERIRKEVPEALEYLEKHPELKTEMAAAVKKLEELEEIANVNSEAEAKIDDAVAKRNESFMKAVETFNAAARANEAARAKMEAFEKKGNGTDAEYQEILDEIHKTENDQAQAQADKEKAEADYNEAEAKIRGEQEEKVNSLNDRMNARDEYAKEEQQYYNENFQEAEASYNTAKQLNEDARAEMADLEKRAEAGENITDEMFQAAEDKIHASEQAMSGAENRMNELKQDQVDAAEVMENWVDRKLGQNVEEATTEAAPAEAVEVEKTEETEKDPEWEKFRESYINDPEYRSIFTNDEEMESAIRKLYEFKQDKDEAETKDINLDKVVKQAQATVEAKKAAETAKAEATEAVEKVEAVEANPDDGFETAEQRGLFAKLKDFFKGNARSKAGAERVMKQQGGFTGFKRFAYAAMMSLSLFMMSASGLGKMNINAPNLDEANVNMGPQVVYAADENFAEADEKKAEVKEARLDDVAENLDLEVDINAEKGVPLADLVKTKAYGEDVEVNISYGDYSGESVFFSEDKHGKNNLAEPLYDMETPNLTDAQKAEQIAEGLANILDDPIEQGQFAALGGTDVVIDGKVDGITSLEDMNEVLDLAMQDDEFRQTLADYNREMYLNLVDAYDLKIEHRAKGTHHRSLYASRIELEDGTVDVNYAIDKDGVLAREDFDALQFVDEDGNNVLDKNDIGGYKYNFLKGIGIIPEDATDEEAQDIMSKIRIIGFSGKCAQLIWENVTPNTGEEKAGNETGTEKEGDEGSGDEKQGEEGTGTEKEGDETGTEKEGEEGTGTEKEGEEGTGTEKEGEETGTEKEGSETGTEKEGSETGTEKEGEETGTEKEGEETGTEKEGSETGTEKEGSETGTEKEGDETGTEKEGSETGTEKEGIEAGPEKEGDETGTEKEGDETGDGKTDILPGDDNDGWTEEGPTQEETGPTTEAERTPVDEGGNGFVNDNNPGDSSQLAQDDFLNGGDQGGGNTDADGGGSTDTDTEATYDGSDTSGWQGNDQSEEPGTQDVPEASTPEEVNAINDSEANPESAGEDITEPEAIQEDHDEIMDRLG